MEIDRYVREGQRVRFDMSSQQCRLIGRWLPDRCSFFPALVPWLLLVMFVTNSRPVPATQNSVSRASCKWEFESYTPSPWELQYLELAPEIKKKPDIICEVLTSAFENCNEWIKFTAAWPGMIPPPSRIFSYFIFDNSCSKEKINFFIEPLVANFRHPHAIPHCKPPLGAIVEPEDRSYILVNGVSADEFSAAYPGKRYRFDLGSNKYKTGLSLFVDAYKKHGITFDEIWAWELGEFLPSVYWSEVDRKVAPKLHFYNVPVSSNISDPFNPMNIVREIFSPGDYIVSQCVIILLRENYSC